MEPSVKSSNFTCERGVQDMHVEQYPEKKHLWKDLRIIADMQVTMRSESNEFEKHYTKVFIQSLEEHTERGKQNVSLISVFCTGETIWRMLYVVLFLSFYRGVLKN